MKPTVFSRIGGAIYQLFYEANQLITASAIKNILIGNDHRSRMLIKIFEEYIADVKKMIAKDHSEFTWTKYKR